MDISALLRTVAGVNNELTSSPKNYNHVFEQLDIVVKLRNQKVAISAEMNKALEKYLGFAAAIADLEEREKEIISELMTMAEHKQDVPKIKYSPNQKIDELELSTRTYNTLHRSGHETIADVLSEKNFDGIRYLGKASIKELVDKMHEAGYTNFNIQFLPKHLVPSLIRTGDFFNSNAIMKCYNNSMKNEIEAQFLDIDKDDIRSKLKNIGAVLEKPEVLMRRVVFYTGEHSFARVRDEGSQIIMTYKNISDDHSILGTKEVNIEVNDYEDAILFLKGCGLKIKACQESKREIWKYSEAEICIDTWPWIPTFIEIEGPTEESVWKTANKLGLEKELAKFGSVDTTYQHYYGVEPDIINMHTPEILFDMKPPEWAGRDNN